MKRLRGLLIILSGIAAMFITTGLVKAAKDDSIVNFNVQAQIPENQIDKKQSYFDLKMNPGQTQTVSTVVQNTSNKAMKIKNEIHTAHTNENGQIEYVTEAKKQDSTLKVPLKKITQLHEAKVITVPANSTKKVSATIRVPDNAKTGVILGAWYFERVDTKRKDKKTGVTVNNKYSYAVAMKLTVNHEVSVALKLNDVKPGLRNYKKGIFANLQNTAAVIIPDLTVQGKVYQQGSNKVVKQAKLQQMIMAPNSNFDFPILFGGEELKPGKYTLKMTAKNANDTWHFKRNFTIRASDANKINNKSLDKAKTSHPGLYMLEGAGVVIVLGVVIGGATWWFRRRR
ncbi:MULTISPECIES: DUF916 and DUF3324 domain-containing protein [Furfurilactobacillus]|uniref:DUF916 and DUF3324 domain-containing protein n=2 Tax=Furfurilactobacillus TaxID=2767882 RepID=A0ABT6DAN7_9LACO|nr:DUF916 and DUF3324 domain-containing protein [Furfurilactobacillus milii]QLE65508.1 cell surface protein precursor [Furfurilactobacillus rossiae]MCF6161222.1 DUF916 and DUF3324 domain-containing protein [Furfurilactobacillus milii]MCF6163523.1 DUF916 and DUF3324 domain-containing protein [Furfurilactobacillus milii]MDF9913810.1 DUF916 and DUF3324 domain-containing protein [Furfurilactobacillus milii]MYV05307.1 DUF3324 domain-containing protein [Furfurilactobacillus milii]